MFTPTDNKPLDDLLATAELNAGRYIAVGTALAYMKEAYKQGLTDGRQLSRESLWQEFREKMRIMIGELKEQ